LITEWQAHGGAVNTSTSPKVRSSGRTGQRLRAGGAAWPVDRPRRPIRRPSWRSRRVQQGSTALFYSADWQVLEERDGGGVARVSMVWSPVYIDAMIARDRDSHSNGSLEERLFVAHDANWNVSSIMNTSGTVQERYVMDPFGSPTFLNASWSTIGSSAYAWSHLHQGGRHSGTARLYHFRNRDLSPNLGRWVTVDPISPHHGDVNRYAYLRQNPFYYTDSMGLEEEGGKGGKPSAGQVIEIGKKIVKVATQPVGPAVVLGCGGIFEIENSICFTCPANGRFYLISDVADADCWNLWGATGQNRPVCGDDTLFHESGFRSCVPNQLTCVHLKAKLICTHEGMVGRGDDSSGETTSEIYSKLCAFEVGPNGVPGKVLACQDTGDISVVCNCTKDDELRIFGGPLRPVPQGAMRKGCSTGCCRA
ncbi:MAG TPA: RHS repeat-associated core domain-containing protein, partial [Gemmatales bacterium]|nr:RHS repeat-associated core domain-containing protein [Gemmatales bacterium]